VRHGSPRALAFARAFAALACAAWLSGVAAQPADCTAMSSLAGATRTIANAAGELAGPLSVPVPDWLPLAVRSERQTVRYALDVGRCRDSSAAAIWLFRVGAPYRIHADGRPLALLSARAMLRAEPAVAGLLQPHTDVYNGRIPALFALPQGARVVTVELQTLPYIPSGLVDVRLGPANLLLPVQASSVEDVVAYADAASGVVLVVGVMALLLWLQRRNDYGLLWLAVACGLWGLRGLAYFSHAVYLRPIAFEQFNPLNVLLASAALAASVSFLLGGLTRRRTMRLLAAVAACVLALAAAGWAGTGAAAARALCLATGFGIIVSAIVWVWRGRSDLPRWHVMTLVGGLGALLGCAVHDLMVVSGTLPPSEPSYVFWGFVFLLTGFAAMSGQYVVMTLNRAERSNEELERHVASKTRELEHSYELLRESEHDAARAQERGRLLRDMHDGLGAQLVTALRGLERGALGPADLARSLQEGLDELRLLMDSTDLGHYLPAALAAWRNRWDARLLAAGVTLEWNVDESLDQVQLSSESALQVMRILQEAAANIVKHSQARRMTMDARVERQPAVLRIEITDDGVGVPEDATRPGSRGLKNMRYRAAQIGAVLEVVRRGAPDQGTHVLLSLPLDAAQTTSPRLTASIAASARDEIPSLR
jgi:signal transduction histidine kinase